MSERPLSGCKVLVCRPEDRAANLLKALQQAGAEPVLLPVVKLCPLPPDASQQELAQRLAEFDVVVVVSPTAARLGTGLLEQWWPQWPQDQNWLAVGAATAALLRDAGLPVQLPPPDAERSEGLLGLPALQKPRRVLLLRGTGGRTLLREALRSRGAVVEELVLYERQVDVTGAGRLRELLATGGAQALVALSSDTLAALQELAGPEQKQLEWMPVVVPGPRVAECATALGFRQILQADGVREQNLVAALGSYFDERA